MNQYPSTLYISSWCSTTSNEVLDWLRSSGAKKGPLTLIKTPSIKTSGCGPVPTVANQTLETKMFEWFSSQKNSGTGVPEAFHGSSGESHKRGIQGNGDELCSRSILPCSVIIIFC